ncbi:MAG TPA: HAD family hydrolase [Polyangia bacterium]
MSFDLIVFDLDGTLVDSLPDITRALNLALGALDPPLGPLPPDVVRGLVGEGVVTLAEKALVVATGVVPAQRTAEAVAETIRGIYRAEPCVHTRLYDGMEAVLRSLRAPRGDAPPRRLAVLTNKPGEVMRPLLTALGLDAQLDAAIGDGDGHPKKPDPSALHTLMNRFAVSPARTLMVGDGLPDMAVARAANCPAAAALWGYTNAPLLEATSPQFRLAGPRELLNIA